MLFMLSALVSIGGFPVVQANRNCDAQDSVKPKKCCASPGRCCKKNGASTCCCQRRDDSSPPPPAVPRDLQASLKWMPWLDASSGAFAVRAAAARDTFAG